jgi:hypothetical protein
MTQRLETGPAASESARDYIERYAIDRATFRSDDSASTTRSFANMEDDLQIVWVNAEASHRCDRRISDRGPSVNPLDRDANILPTRSWRTQVEPDSCRPPPSQTRCSELVHSTL